MEISRDQYDTILRRLRRVYIDYLNKELNKYIQGKSSLRRGKLHTDTSGPSRICTVVCIFNKACPLAYRFVEEGGKEPQSSNVWSSPIRAVTGREQVL